MRRGTRLGGAALAWLVGCSGGGRQDTATGATAATETATTGSTSVGPTSATTSSTSGTDTDDPKFDVMGDGDVPDDGPIIPETCAQASSGESTVGCEFFAVDLDTIFQTNQYAVAVANVQQSAMATVTVEVKTGAVWNVVGAPQTVAAKDLHVFNLPDLHQTGTGVLVGGAYRITSDVPIIAYQFNPLEGGSETSDASMLYPTSTWDTINYVVGWVRNPSSNQPGYVVIAAEQDGTQVEVTPSVATDAGGPIPAGSPGVPFTVDLDEGDIAEITVTTQGESLTGTTIKTPDGFPVGVFTGSPCAYVPEGNLACDHLEEQLAGARLWGTSFIASRLAPREPATPENQLWQVYASQDDTTITFSAAAAVTGLPQSPAVLQGGEMLQFLATGSASDPGDFVVDADKPITILGYMIGAHSLMAFPQSQIGDPCVVQISPTEQFLPRYVVFVPSQWLTDYAVITRVPGSEVRIDDVAVPDSEFVSVGSYEVGRPSVADGVHLIEGDDPFAVIITGYDDFDSYAYLGGVGTGKINPNPEG